MSQTNPFFIPQKEFDLINQMNEDLIDEIIGQSGDIYKVNALYEVFSGIFDHPIGIWLMGPIVTLCFDEE